MDILLSALWAMGCARRPVAFEVQHWAVLQSEQEE